MRNFFCVLLGFFIFICHSLAVASNLGLAFTFPIITSDPPKLKGNRISLRYLPTKLKWGHSKIYFDGSYGHWWLDNASNNHEISIYALAPVYRYYFFESAQFSPFGEISIGLSYLSRTRLDDHNLGMHFAFQDQIAIGTTFGPAENLSVSLGAMHYSNGSLCLNNRGMSIPLAINVGYRF